MELDDKGRPQPTGEFDTLEADSVVLALGQVRPTAASCATCPGVDAQAGRRGGGGPAHDDRPSRHVRRRRHGAERAHRHGGDRPRQAGGAQHRCLAARAGLRRAATCRRWSRSTCCICRCSATSIVSQQQRLEDERAAERLRRGAGRADRSRGAARGAALPVLRRLLRVRQLLRRLSGAGDHRSSGRATATASIRCAAPAARCASSSAHAMRSRWSPEDDLEPP